MVPAALSIEADFRPLVLGATTTPDRGMGVWWPLAGVVACPLGERREPAIAAGWCREHDRMHKHLCHENDYMAD